MEIRVTSGKTGRSFTLRHKIRSREHKQENIHEAGRCEQDVRDNRSRPRDAMSHEGSPPNNGNRKNLIQKLWSVSDRRNCDEMNTHCAGIDCRVARLKVHVLVRMRE